MLDLDAIEARALHVGEHGFYPNSHWSAGKVLSDVFALVAELRMLREEGTQLDAVLLDRNMKIAALAKRVEGLEAMVAAVGAGAMTEPLWAECVSIAERRASPSDSKESE